MPAFSKLKDNELAEVITYIRNDLGNKVGDEIQPDKITPVYDDDNDEDDKNKVAP